MITTPQGRRAQRAHETAKPAGLLAGAITAFASFCCFALFGFGIEAITQWMVALTLLAASATYAAATFVAANRLRRSERPG